jgi:hypothetical protein
VYAAARVVNSSGMLAPSSKRSQADGWADALVDLIRRCDTGDLRPDGYPTSTTGGGRSSNDPANLTSVEQAVDTLVFGGLRRDSVFELTEAWAAHLLEAAAHLKAAANLAELLPTVTDVRRTIGQTQATCDSLDEHDEFCGEPVYSRGRCKACYEWLRTHPGVAVVERTVVSARKRNKGRPARLHEETRS